MLSRTAPAPRNVSQRLTNSLAAAIRLCIAALLLGCVHSTPPAEGRTGGDGTEAAAATAADAELRSRVEKLEEEVAELKQILRANAASSAPTNVAVATAATEGEVAGTISPSASIATAVRAPVSVLTPEYRKELDFLHNTTINVGLDGYYSCNFNASEGPRYAVGLSGTGCVAKKSLAKRGA